MKKAIAGTFFGALSVLFLLPSLVFADEGSMHIKSTYGVFPEIDGACKAVCRNRTIIHGHVDMADGVCSFDIPYSECDMGDTVYFPEYRIKNHVFEVIDGPVYVVTSRDFTLNTPPLDTPYVPEFGKTGTVASILISISGYIFIKKSLV